MTSSWDPLGGEAGPAARRPVYAYVYELITGDPQDGPHPYVGKAKDPRERVYGRRPTAHTSRQSVAKDPWKARILPAPHGFRTLETVPATGDPIEDERTLRTAEAYWMRKLKATHNDQRPAYDAAGRPVSRRLTSPPAPRPGRVAPRRTQQVRSLAFLGLFLLALVLLVRLCLAGGLTGAPLWLAPPVPALVAASMAFRLLDGLVVSVRGPARRRRRSRR